MKNLEASRKPELHLAIDGQNWTVHLTKMPFFKSDTKYAFYLLKNGVRVAHCRYGRQLTAKFENDGAAGHYHARAFIKSVSEGDVSPTINIVDSPRVSQIGSPYDLKKWNFLPITELNFNCGWGFSAIKDGIYHFIEGGRTLDVQIFGMENALSKKEILVCFRGAISKREYRSAPFFPGIGIAKQLGVPVVSISDPSLARSHSLTLGWYAGHEGFTDVPFRIANLLDSLVLQLNCRLVVFGGSGGGFASLLVLSLLKTDKVSAFVWNPQTSISRYTLYLVECYLDISFPSISSKLNIRERLDLSGVVHDVLHCAESLMSQRSILYVQNKTDWHVESHAKPFIEKAAFMKKASEEVFSCQANFSYFLGGWGKGHVAPPREIILSALKGLLSGDSPLVVALRIEQEIKDLTLKV
ncbi:hypothetical protein [Microbulbifer sp. JMSA008]|uniref:hypothetical protein n=1 Tax=unclassified Microbulbifer TaxID=2619833 RepID=UPI00403AD4C0